MLASKTGSRQQRNRGFSGTAKFNAQQQWSHGPHKEIHQRQRKKKEQGLNDHYLWRAALFAVICSPGKQSAIQPRPPVNGNDQ